MIRRYYHEEIINLNNKDAFNSYDLNDKINNLRQYAKSRFNWEGYIAFLPNPYYAKKVVFFNYKHKYSFYSNKKSPYLHQNLDISYIEKIGDIDKEKAFIEWDGIISEDIRENWFLLQEVSDATERHKNANAFIHTPIKGITILGFKEPLKPLYLGSRSAKSVSRDGYELSQGPEILECGTGNWPLLLYLESCWNPKNEKIKIQENV